MSSHTAALAFPPWRKTGWWLCGYLEHWIEFQFCCWHEGRDGTSVVETIKCGFIEECVWRRRKWEKDEYGRKQCSHIAIERWKSDDTWHKKNGRRTVTIWRKGSGENGFRDANYWSRLSEQNLIENIYYFWYRNTDGRTESTFNFMYFKQNTHII